MRSPQSTEPTSVAIVSLGQVGRDVAVRVNRELPSYRIVAACARNWAKAGEFLSDVGIDAELCDPSDAYLRAEIVIECAPAAIYRQIVEPAIRAGRTVITLSVGALLENWDLVGLAERHSARIHVPSGAMMGLDALQAAALDEIHSVTIETRKPPAGLRNARRINELGIDVTAVTEPRLVFAGTAREAIAGFPANLNVAVAVSLAGIGPDATMLEVWLDPSVKHNTHHVRVDAAAALLDFTIANVPTANAATGRLTALSVVALLRKMRATLAIGT